MPPRTLCVALLLLGCETGGIVDGGVLDANAADAERQNDAGAPDGHGPIDASSRDAEMFTDALLADADAQDRGTVDADPQDVADAEPQDIGADPQDSGAVDADPQDAEQIDLGDSNASDAAAALDASAFPDASIDPCADTVFYGSCISRRVSDSSVESCRDYILTSGYPSSATLSAGCSASNGSIVRTWETSACPRATSVGGCLLTSPGPMICYQQIDWYYPPQVGPSVQSTCVGSGRAFLAP